MTRRKLSSSRSAIKCGRSADAKAGATRHRPLGVDPSRGSKASYRVQARRFSLFQCAVASTDRIFGHVADSREQDLNISEKDQEVARWYADDLEKGEANVKALVKFLRWVGGENPYLRHQTKPMEPWVMTSEERATIEGIPE